MIAAGWTLDHDRDLMSPVLGEPVRRGRLLLYRHDAEVFLCGWPLTGERTPSAAELLDAAAWAAEAGATRLHLWGPALIEPPGWDHWYLRVPAAHDRLLQIELADYDHAAVRRQRNHQRARNSRYGLRTAEGYPGPEPLRLLLPSYLERPDIPAPQREIIALATRPELYVGARCFLALDGERPVGLQVCRPLPRGTVLARWSLFAPVATGASDLLYLAMIEHYRRAGARALDLGYGVTPTLYAYKLRWGVNRLLGPVWRCGFRRPPSHHASARTAGDQTRVGPLGWSRRSTESL